MFKLQFYISQESHGDVNWVVLLTNTLVLIMPRKSWDVNWVVLLTNTLVLIMPSLYINKSIFMSCLMSSVSFKLQNTPQQRHGSTLLLFFCDFLCCLFTGLSEYHLVNGTVLAQYNFFFFFFFIKFNGKRIIPKGCKEPDYPSQVDTVRLWISFHNNMNCGTLCVKKRQTLWVSFHNVNCSTLCVK